MTVTRPPAGDSPWLWLCPDDAVEVMGLDRDHLASLPSGTPVVLVLDEPLARSRARRLARRTGLDVQRELIVLPNTRHPLVLIDDEPAAVEHLWRDVAAVPPGACRSAPLLALALRMAPAMPWEWTGALAPGRVLVGVRR